MRDVDAERMRLEFERKIAELQDILRTVAAAAGVTISAGQLVKPVTPKLVT